MAGARGRNFEEILVIVLEAENLLRQTIRPRASRGRDAGEQ